MKEKLLQLPQYKIFIFGERLRGRRLLRQSNEAKKNVNHSDVEKENEEIDDSNNNIVINNSNSKEDNKI